MLSQLRRFPDNPLLRPDDLQLPSDSPLFDPSAVFNPGAVLVDDTLHLLLRVQDRGRRTWLLHATQGSRSQFHVDPEPVRLLGLEGRKVFHGYDPRITALEGRLFVFLALDMEQACHTGLFEWTTRDSLQLLRLFDEEPARNSVLFPGRPGGRYWMLDRPNTTRAPGEPASGDRIVARSSEDLQDWRREGELLRGRPHFWDERIGAGPPPLLTSEGWLLLYHGVATHFGAAGVYQAGLALLDAQDPSRLLFRSRQNILEPRFSYEQTGQVPNVVFPTAWTVSDQVEGEPAPDTAIVRVYYGAADTRVCMAEATVRELLDACRAV